MLYWIIGVVVLIILLIVFLIVFKNYKISKRRNDIIKLFGKIATHNGITDYKIEYVKKDTHDFYFETAKHIYYIKVIFDHKEQEICINNSTKWQLRAFHDSMTPTQFVSGVEPLMRLDLENREKKEHKLFIIYPNARALLKVINECEMVFVYPDTDVYGSTVVTYKKMVEDLDLLDI